MNRILVENLEKKIRKVEGFNVKVIEDGKDKYGNAKQALTYNYSNALPNDRTISQWIKGRFKKTNPMFDVEVLDGRGNSLPNQTKLGNVRESYR